MGRTGDGTLRRIEALFRTGRTGSWSDGRLLASFADGRGVEREDAFAALVRRHGPMVLATCRRMLGASPDADDAFQAVFLVLARKAGSLRDVDDVGGWLRVVAVRTGREARARAARLRAREGAGLGDSHAAAGVDPDLFELRSALDEELERLPGGFREAIRLCELEGLSRREAAERLGLAEGTLSSRLARGRSLLRDRLARRGLAVGLLGAALAPEPRAALADAAASLAVHTTRSGAAPGTVSEAVASLAEGAFAMLVASRWKSLVASAGTLGVLALAAGLAWSQAAPAPDEPPPGALPKVTPAAPSPVHVFVMEADGGLVAGAEVRLNPYTFDERIGTTGRDGRCVFQDPPGLPDDRSVLVSVDGGRLVGAWRWRPFMDRGTRSAPVGIEVRPPREVEVRVVDVHGEPVAGAEVEGVANRRVVAHAEAGADGRARLLIPAGETSLRWIAARRRGVGLGYAEFGDQDHRGTDIGVAASELPRSVEVSLAPQTPVQIRVVDEAGAPVTAGRIYQPGHRHNLAYAGRLVGERIGPDGVARFDWYPRSSPRADFGAVVPPRGVGSVEIGFGASDSYLLRVRRPATIRGRVTMPDGSPARDVMVQGLADAAVTAVDGSYEIAASPEPMQAVWVVDGEYAAPARMDVVPRAEAPVEVDFRLAKGLPVRGVVTAGPDHHPEPGLTVWLVEEGVPIPEGVPKEGAAGDSRKEATKVKRDEAYLVKKEAPGAAPQPRVRKTGRSVLATTDERGRYTFRVAPGTYRIAVPTLRRAEIFEVRDETGVVRDFHKDRQESRLLAGRVVDERGEPVAGARVEAMSTDGLSATRPLTTDGEGRFRADARPVSHWVTATSDDGLLAGYIEAAADAEDFEVVMKPAARATGIVCDRSGEPRPRQMLLWERLAEGRREDGEAWTFTIPGPSTFADDAGRFTSPPLVPGLEYRAELIPQSNRPPDFADVALGPVRPTGPGPLDLGAMRVDDRPLEVQFRERREREREAK